MTTITGKFDIKSTPSIADDNLKKMNGIAMIFEKSFLGPLNATSKVSMFGIMNKELGSGGYIAMELIEGQINNKKGTFIMQHSCFMDRGQEQQQIQIIPDSGTCELTC